MRLALPLVLLACRPTPPPTPPVEAPVVTVPQPAHASDLGGVLRDHLVRGDHPRAVSAAARLRDELAPLTHDGELLGPWTEAMSALDALQATTDVTPAAYELGRLGQACGACHTAGGAHLSDPPVTRTSQADGVRAEMERHADALRQLWFGLVAPSDRYVDAGVAAFEASFLQPMNGPPSDAALAMDDAVTRSAQALRATTDPAARAAHLSSMITACSVCHRGLPGGVTIEPD